MSDTRIDLLEAEELRKAIVGGEVDAFVVGREEGKQKVLLLANAYQRYRQMVEAMHQGAITTSPQGGILYANQRFSNFLGVPLARLYTAPLQSYIGIAHRAALSELLLRGIRGAELEVTFSRRDGEALPARLSVASVDDYASILVTDLRPMQWASLAVEALDSIRDSVDKLRGELPAGASERQALDDIGEKIDGLAQLIATLRRDPGAGRDRAA